MAYLDDSRVLIDPATVPARPAGMKWGLIAGVASVILSTLFTMTGLMTPGKSNWMVNVINLCLVAAICILAIRQHRDEELGGFISLGRCVSLGLWIGLIAGIIGAIYGIIYVKVINPNFMNDLTDAIKEQTIARGQSEEQADQAAKFGTMFANPFMLAAFSLIGSIIFYVLGTLIAGLFMKKDPPIPA